MNYKKISKVLLIAVIVLVIICIGKYFYIQSTLPHIDTAKLLERSVPVYSDNLAKNEYFNTNDNPNRKFIPISKIPVVLRNATVAIEDKNFYHAYNNCSVMGQLFLCTDKANTCKYSPNKITQQIVKNIFQDSDDYRLEKQIFLPCHIDNELSKDEILQLFLNESQYSSLSYGVESASKEFFKKDVEELNLAESTILAVLPQSPLYYSPFGKNRDQLIAKQVYLLDSMVNQGYITREEAEIAKNARLPF